MSDAVPQSGSNRLVAGITAIGQAAINAGHRLGLAIRYVGGMGHLLFDTLIWLGRGMFTGSVKFGFSAVAGQMVRVGVRSIPIIVLVQTFIGIILALQMAPTLEAYGSLERIADIVGISMFRELGPLLSAIVLSGFAGASIAAEIGAMKEAEEIKALKAHALNPYHFLVMPRLLATVIMLTGLTVIADVVGVFGGFITSWLVLEVPPATYVDLTQSALSLKDLFTGLFKAAVFGMLIALIACCEGLRVSGGAEGVGRATTATVVKSIVALIGVDALFTAVFYVFEI